MDYEIIRINEESWRVEDSGVRFFLLVGTERALLVDSGRNMNNARDIAETLTDKPLLLLNTHADGDHVAGNGRNLEIIHIPGHTPGSIALLDTKYRVLISGDPIQNGRIFMFGQFRNMKNYIRSLEHLQRWKDQFDEIWPSHASIPVYPDLIDKLREGAQSILNGEVAGRPEEVFGNKICAYDLGFATFLCDL